VTAGGDVGDARIADVGGDGRGDVAASLAVLGDRQAPVLELLREHRLDRLDDVARPPVRGDTDVDTGHGIDGTGGDAHPPGSFTER
jgi:hypothetical protein